MSAPRPFDTTLRELASRYCPSFLYWLRGQEATLQELLDPVLITQERRADLLLRFTDAHAQTAILHIEFQRSPDMDLPLRMLEYAVRILRRYDHPPQQVLILIEPSEAAMRVPSIFQAGGLQVSYQVIRLWEQDPNFVLERGLVGLIPLVPLMGTADRPVGEVLDACAEVVRSEVESEQEQKSLLLIASALGSLRRSSRGEIEAFLRRVAMFDLLETPLMRELLGEAEQRAERRGEERGERRGEERGEERGARRELLRTITLLLGRKFGSVPGELSAKLESITELARLEQLTVAVLDCASLEEFAARL